MSTMELRNQRAEGEGLYREQTGRDKAAGPKQAAAFRAAKKTTGRNAKKADVVAVFSVAVAGLGKALMSWSGDRGHVTR
jgi:hypothetical protein